MEKKLLIICETGISAALLVSKTLEEVRNQNKKLDVNYAQTEKLEEKFSCENYDYIVLTPQVYSKEKIIKKLINEKQNDPKIIKLSLEEYKYMKVTSLLKKIGH